MIAYFSGWRDRKRYKERIHNDKDVYNGDDACEWQASASIYKWETSIRRRVPGRRSWVSSGVLRMKER